MRRRQAECERAPVCVGETVVLNEAALGMKILGEASDPTTRTKRRQPLLWSSRGPGSRGGSRLRCRPGGVFSAIAAAAGRSGPGTVNSRRCLPTTDATADRRERRPRLCVVSSRHDNAGQVRAVRLRETGVPGVFVSMVKGATTTRRRQWSGCSRPSRLRSEFSSRCHTTCSAHRHRARGRQGRQPGDQSWCATTYGPGRGRSQDRVPSHCQRCKRPERAVISSLEVDSRPVEVWTRRGRAEACAESACAIGAQLCRSRRGCSLPATETACSRPSAVAWSSELSMPPVVPGGDDVNGFDQAPALAAAVVNSTGECSAAQPAQAFSPDDVYGSLTSAAMLGRDEDCARNESTGDHPCPGCARR